MPLLTRSNSASIGIGELLRKPSFISPEVCFPDMEVGKHANTKPNQAINNVPHLCRGQCGEEGTAA